jgi:outer membrane protein TolC
MLLAFLATPALLFSQNKFTLNQVISIAQQQSPDAILAKHSFRTKYWEYRSFRANYLPSLSASGKVPYYNSYPSQIQDDNGNYKFVQSKYLTNIADLSINQNIGPTGGVVYLESELQRIDKVGAGSYSQYISSPISFGIKQPIFTYNSLKWDKKIEPLVYEKAKKDYISTVEEVSLKAISRFFDLANAQLNLAIAKTNFSNSDTLFKIAQGRYNIGTIAENDLLQMQLSLLSAQTALNKAEVDLELQKSRLRSFLGYNEKLNFELIIPDSIPGLQLEYQKVMDLAQQNNPNVINRTVKLLEAQRGVAQAKGQRGREINITASYGLSHDAVDKFQEVYGDPFRNSQQLQVGFTIPIIDWGQGKGKVKMAQSQQELTEVQVSQEQADFEQDIFLQVMQFNLQDDQVNIAAKTEHIAQSRFDVTKQRFLIGKIDVLNLNDALKEKDNSKRSYFEALENYWYYFYYVRQLTLFDFLQDKPLGQDFDLIVK